MAKVRLIVRHSRHGSCPAVHAVDGALTLATGETVPKGMALVQGYIPADPSTTEEVELDDGEGLLAVHESLILAAADAIRARQG